MKRVFIASVLLLSAVSVSVWSNIAFEKNMKEFSEMLDNLIVCSEKSDDKTLAIGMKDFESTKAFYESLKTKIEE